MEIPVHDVVNTGEETFRVGDGVTGLINISLKRCNVKWNCEIANFQFNLINF